MKIDINTKDPQEIHHVLVSSGEHWRSFWAKLDTDGVFEYLFDNVPAFLHNGYIHKWNGQEWANPKHDVKDWILEHAGYADCGDTALLYEHSQGIEEGSNPWMLFQYITGIAQTTQGMGLNSLMGAGETDTLILGKALMEYSYHRAAVEGFVELILMHGGE